MAATTRTQAERLWLIVGGLVTVFLLLVGYFLLIAPQRSETDDVNASLAAARAQNVGLTQRIAALRIQSRNSATIATQLAAAQRALPPTSGLPDFLRTVQSLGNATLTRVTSMTIGAPVDVSALASSGAAAAQPATGATSPSPSATPAPDASTAGTANTAPTGPSVYGLSITAQVTGSPDALNHFLDQLQKVQPRAVLITQLTEGGGAGGVTTGSAAGTSLQLTMQAFVAPASAGESAGLAAASH